MTKTHAHRAVTGALWSALNVIIPNAVTFGVFLVLSRSLRPSDFGIVALATSLPGLISAVTPAGFGPALVQAKDIDNTQLYSVFWLTFGWGFLLYIGTLLALPLFVGLYDEPILGQLVPVAALSLIFGCAGIVPNALVSRRLAFHLFTIRVLITSGVVAAASIGLVLAGFGLWALVVSQLASSLVGMTTSFVAARWRPKLKFGLRGLRPLASYALYASGTTGVQTIMAKNDQLIVGYYFSPHGLGLYNFSKRIYGLLNDVIGGALMSTTQPIFSAIQTEIDRVRRGFLAATQLSSLAAFPLFAGLACVADRAVPLLFGNHWVSAIPLVQIQCALGIITCIGVIQAGLITSQGRAKWWFYYQLISSGLSIAIVVAAAPLGVTAMLALVVAKTYLIWPAPIRLSLRLVNLRLAEYLANFRAPVVSTLGMCAAIWLERYFSPALPPVTALALDIVVGAVVYTALAFLLARKMLIELFGLLLARFRTPRS